MASVLIMTTDPGIVNQPLHQLWGNNNPRFQWPSVNGGGLNLPNGVTIIVIAHGNGQEIGDAQNGISLNADKFICRILQNMQHGAPAAIFIATCGVGIAEFVGNVRNRANDLGIWGQTRLFGHSDPVPGNVPVPPPPNNPYNLDWTEIV